MSRVVVSYEKREQSQECCGGSRQIGFSSFARFHFFYFWKFEHSTVTHVSFSRVRRIEIFDIDTIFGAMRLQAPRHPWTSKEVAGVLGGRRLSTRLQALERFDAIIVGGGPAGMATALALQKTGWSRCLVLEKREEPEVMQGGTALGLWTNAWKALDALGVGDRVRESSGRVNRVELCREDGDRVLTSFDLATCDGGPHEFGGVLRGRLVQCLADAIDKQKTELKFGVECRSCVVDEGGGVMLETHDGHTYGTHVLIGADGVNSVVAHAYGDVRNRTMGTTFVGQTAIRGIAEYASKDDMPMCIRQVLGTGVRAGVYPVSSHELYWYVCFPDTEWDGDIIEQARDVLSSSKESWKTSIVWDAINRTPAGRVSRNRLSDRWDLAELFPRNSVRNSPIALAGDALHPMTPNLGQGGCTALEDAVILASYLQECVGNENIRPCDRIDMYTRERARRCIPLTVRANLMGLVLQSALAPVVFARDTFISNAFDPSHFLDHATFDCSKRLSSLQ